MYGFFFGSYTKKRSGGECCSTNSGSTLYGLVMMTNLSNEISAANMLEHYTKVKVVEGVVSYLIW